MGRKSSEIEAQDPRSRRESLFEIHSILRSVDNLRPDEALDELVKLYSTWFELGPVGFDAARRADPSITLSKSAYSRATERLGPLFDQRRPDTGADLFQELADVGVRAGLGQYFTPAPVASAIARYLAPSAGESWVDPFCGSGLLIGHLETESSGPLELFGVDRDPRVLRLAQLEAKIHHPASPTRLLQSDALVSLGQLRADLGAPKAGFDGVVTNPPFGASVHREDYSAYEELSLFTKAGAPLEILGIERSVQLLRPGGRLAIVVPQSILSNRGCRATREFLLQSCDVDGVLSLPPETFGPFRGVGKAAVIFARRQGSAKRKATRTALAISRSIGWDGSGRASGAADVGEVAEALKRNATQGHVALVSDRDAMARNMTPEWHLRPRTKGRSLADLCSAIFCGRTPGRGAYAATGDENKPHVYRVLKVADLTGSGIDWNPGQRSHAAFARPVSSKLLELGDVVTTAAAHHPRYIGAKVDVVDRFPETLGNQVFPCAEVLALRPRSDELDSIQLMLWLRTQDGRSALQACVTGQTAHLYPDDVGEIVVPTRVLESEPTKALDLARRSIALRREAESAAVKARAEFERAVAA